MTALEQWPAPAVLPEPTADRPCVVCGQYPSMCAATACGTRPPRAAWPRTEEQQRRDRAKHRAGQHRRRRRFSLELDQLLGLGKDHEDHPEDQAPVRECGRCGTMIDPDGSCYTCRTRR